MKKKGERHFLSDESQKSSCQFIMKITELRCTSCNGSLKMDEHNPHVAICEYCSSTYVLEDDGSNGFRLGQKTASSWYTPREPVKRQEKKTGWEAYGWKRCLCVSLVGFVVLIGFNLLRLKINPPKSSEPSIPELSSSVIAETSSFVETTPITGILASMIEQVYQKPLESVTEEELSRFQWLEISYHSDFVSVGYSFDNPYDSPEAALTWMQFPGDHTQVALDGLYQLKGLKKIDVPSYLSSGSLDGLSLLGLGCGASSPAEAAKLVTDPSSIQELYLRTGLESLDGISEFQHVTNLSLNGSHLKDLKDLVNLKELRSLKLKNCDDVNDFSFLSVMTNLQELSLESEKIYDIGFLSDLTQLESLELLDAKILNVNALAGHSALTRLTLDNCSELADLGVLTELNGLTELFLDLPYNCPQPDLNGLNNMKVLTLDGIKSTSFLRNMPSLQSLSLRYSSIDDPFVFSSLEQLSELSCYHVSGDITDWAFISRIPHLKTLNLNGLATYEDISGLFNINGLETLFLNGAECEIDFSNLQPNESLTTLKMDGVKLYTNVNVSGEGIVYIDYDKVSLNEHTDFLRYYPNLKELSIADNKLTQLDFVSGLPALQTLDIQKNYITDLKPLSGLIFLQSVICKECPVENYRVLREDITIIID